MEDPYLLIRYSGEDIDAFEVVHKSEWSAYVVSTKRQTDFDIDYGSERGTLRFRDAHDYLSGFTFDVLPDDEAAMLLKRFPNGCGDFPWLDIPGAP